MAEGVAQASAPTLEDVSVQAEQQPDPDEPEEFDLFGPPDFEPVAAPLASTPLMSGVGLQANPVTTNTIELQANFLRQAQ